MITKIKEKLYNQNELIQSVLENLGCTYIKFCKVKGDDVFKFGHDEESTGNANILYISTLHYKSYSLSTHGDIITLTCEMKGLSLGDAIKYLADFLGIKFEYTKKEIKLPFLGFWKDLSKIKDNEDDNSITYPKERNLIYSNYGVSKMWIEDNISAQVQEEFGIGYDLITNRITIPWVDIYGSLVGITARLNKKHLTEDEKRFKYYSLISFNKGKNLYGFFQNYKYILEANEIIIVESEKSVLKAREYGYKNVVALGCSTITEQQAKLIKTMCCKVILALDEGLDFEHSVKEIKKCQIINPFFSNELYILDMNMETNKNITKEKVCIFDLCESAIEDSLTNQIIYI